MSKLFQEIDSEIRKINWDAVAIARIDRTKCFYREDPATRKTLTRDHIIPKKYSGGVKYSATVFACATCNSYRGCKFLWEWIEQIGEYNYQKNKSYSKLKWHRIIKNIKFLLKNG